MEVLTLVAILVGPIFALLVSRGLDNLRDERARRMDIFRTLMRTRRTPIHADHVGALNLIEIEFAKDKNVIRAWKALFEHFGATHGRRPDEVVIESTPEGERGERNRRFDDRLFDERQKLLAKLLHAIAKGLGFKAEQLEIFEGGYTPQGWHDVELEQRGIRRLVGEVLFGIRSVKIEVTKLPTEGGDGSGAGAG